MVDGELCALRGGRLDFTALMLGRPRRHAEGVHVVFVLFDLLAAGRQDLRPKPYKTRRSRLLRLLPEPQPYLQVIESTSDEDEARARWFTREAAVRGIEGYLRKPRQGAYGDPDAPWIKRRWRTTVGVLVVGVTGDVNRPRAVVLGYRTPEGEVDIVGASRPLAASVRNALTGRLRPVSDPTVLPRRFVGVGGRDLVYTPVAPEIEVNVDADAAIEQGRWRHPPRVLGIATKDV